MTDLTFEASMVRVYVDEGGYGNDPRDPGGATNRGITIIDARKYAAEFGWIVGREVTIADMKAMPKWFSDKVYRHKYADPMRYNDLPAGFDYSVLDAAINSGVGRAPVWAGKALSIPVKSINDVVAPANVASDKVSIIQKYWAVRLAFLHGLGTWSHFGGGWGRRCAQGEAAAVRMYLSVGSGLSNADANKRMSNEATKAKAKSKKAVTKGAGTVIGTGSAGEASTHPSIDFAHSMGGKILLGIVIAVAVGAAVYFIRQAIINHQRAQAYATA